MSKLKTPQEKKHASLTHDRRNAYGESPHGARKSIPRNKALARHGARRAANRPLVQTRDGTDADLLDAMEHMARTQGRLKRLRGFRKVPDAPLSEVIAHKKHRRAIQAGRKKRAKAMWAAWEPAQT